jgi:hypothetical protein
MVKISNPDTPPPVPLSRERLLRTAIRLADEGGIESLSMRKLAPLNLNAPPVRAIWEKALPKS